MAYNDIATKFQGGGGGISQGVPLPSILNPGLGTCSYERNFINTGQFLLFWPAHLPCAEGSALQCCSLFSCFLVML